MITADREATKYIGLTIEWDYKNGKAHTYMPGYLGKAVTRFGHKNQTTSRTYHIPTKSPKAAQKFNTQTKKTNPPLNKEETKYVQAVMRTLLYYGMAVDSTILTLLSSLATEQAKPMQKTMETVKQLLDYCAMQEEAIITYTASKMILNVHSNAGYLNKKKGCSRAGRHFFLSNNNDSPHNNGAILTNATTIKAVMSSAAEAELGALYLNAKEAIYLRQILHKMGHLQPRTPIQTENTTAEGVII
jgi:hypothetical protein